MRAVLGKPRRKALVAFALAASLVVAACGSDDDDASDAASSSAAEAPSTTAPAAPSTDAPSSSDEESAPSTEAPSSTEESAPSTEAPSGSGVAEGVPPELDGKGQLVVVFMLSGISPFLTHWQDTVVERLEELNFETKVITNQRDPAQQDQQVQQYLATGEEPAAFIWWPASSAAGVNSTKLLSEVAPVIQTNQAVTPAGEEFITLYAGVNDLVNGSVSGQILMNARDLDIAAGRELHSPEGNIVMFNGPDGYQGSIDRLAGFTEVTADAPFNEIASSANANADDGYKNAIALMPKLKEEGVDYLWSFNQSIASGAIKALQQNGIIPGKDIIIVDGSCSIGSETYASGESYGTVLQSAVIEAQVAADSVARYLATGEVVEGVEELPATPEVPPTPITPPAKKVIIPMPPLEGREAVATEMLWGLTVPVLCAQ